MEGQQTKRFLEFIPIEREALFTEKSFKCIHFIISRLTSLHIKHDKLASAITSHYHQNL